MSTATRRLQDNTATMPRTDKTFAIGLQYHPEAALVKWLDGTANASQFMSYNEALTYFKALVEQAKRQ